MEVFTWVKNVDYPRDPTTKEMTAAVHPQLQVQHSKSPERLKSISSVFSPRGSDICYQVNVLFWDSF